MEHNKLVEKELLIIEQYFFPDGWSGTQYPVNIAERMIEEGWKVNVICGNVPYINKNFYKNDPREKGVKIKYIKLPFHQKNTFHKLSNHIFFSIISFLRISFSKKPTLIMVLTNPPPIIIVVYLIKKIFNIPFIIVAMDLYPEVLLKYLSKKYAIILDKIISPFFNISYRSASKVVSLGDSMNKKLLKKGIQKNKIQIIRNWAIGEFNNIKGTNKFIKEWGINSDLTILYSGNLGLAHEWETLLEAMRISELKPKELKILFVASGQRLYEAKKYAKKYLDKDSVLFKSLVSLEDLPLTMSFSDLGVVSLRPSFNGLVYPSKFSGYLARGLPVLFIGLDQEMKQILEKYDAGVSFLPGESLLLANYLKEIHKNKRKLVQQGKNASKYYQDNISKENGLSKYKELINNFKK